MSFEHLPANIEKRVQRFAERQHLLHDEAVLKLIEIGLQRSSSPASDQVAQRNSRGGRLVEGRAPQKTRLEDRPETPDALIGFLEDAPEVAENIRRFADERRSQSFDNS